MKKKVRVVFDLENEFVMLLDMRCERLGLTRIEYLRRCIAADTLSAYFPVLGMIQSTPPEQGER